MNQDFKEFFASLNAKHVEYLIIGGVAFNFHAVPRATKDIDVWVGPSLANLRAFLAGLEEFGFAHAMSPSDLAHQECVLMLGRVPNRIDVLTRPSGLQWEPCWDNRVQANYDGEPVWFIAIGDLIEAKRAAGRPQDLADVSKLETILKMRR